MYHKKLECFINLNILFDQIKFENLYKEVQIEWKGINNEKIICKDMFGR